MTKRQEITTTDLADFGWRERDMLVNLLKAWAKDGLPESFYEEEVRPMFNRNSGCVFLTNSEYQAAMLNGDKLEIWHNCGNCGHEGFEEDCQLSDDGCNQCRAHEILDEEKTDLETYRVEEHNKGDWVK